MSNRTISGQLAALNAGIVGYLDGLPRDVNSILDRDAELSRWVTSIATDLDSLFDDIAVTWSPAEAEFLRNRIHETSRAIQNSSGVLSIFPQTAGLTRVNVNPLHRLIKGMIAKASGKGGAGAGKGTVKKSGRKPKTKPDKTDRAVQQMLDSGDVERYGRKWKGELLRRYADQLPKKTTPDALRKLVEREEARRTADNK